MAMFDTVTGTVAVFPTLSVRTKLYVPFADTVYVAVDAVTTVLSGRVIDATPLELSEAVTVMVTVLLVAAVVDSELVAVGAVVSVGVVAFLLLPPQPVSPSPRMMHAAMHNVNFFIPDTFLMNAISS
jgi:hypothetical protein